MANVTVPQNDKGYNLQFTITNAAGTAFDLTGYTVAFKMWSPGVPGTLLINGTCVVTNTTGGIVTYLGTAGDFGTVGRYHAEVEGTKSGVRESTENFRLTIAESG